jgi:tryptophan 7-halogenase
MTYLVLGGGTAGLLAALALKKANADCHVHIYQSSEIGVIGVGEGTTYVITGFLHDFLDIPPGDFFSSVRPTWKLGIRYLWGARDHFNYTFTHQTNWKWHSLSRFNGFYCREDFTAADPCSALMDAGKVFARLENGDPLVERSAAYHLENAMLIRFLTDRCSKAGIQIHDDTLIHAKRGDKGIEWLEFERSGRQVADLYVDCSGFRGELIGKALAEPESDFRDALFCNRAVVGGWDRRSGESILPYTVAETMNAGWAWRIEHEERIHRGYVFCTDLMSEDAAVNELRNKNPQIGEVRAVAFPSGMRRRSWVENVVAIGNSAGFVEPLEATAIHVICEESRLLAGLLRDHEGLVSDSVKAYYNRRMGDLWLSIRDFLAVHYKFNTRLDTPFWRLCRNEIRLGDAEAVVDYYRAHGPNASTGNELLRRWDPFGVEGYFTMLIGMGIGWDENTPVLDEERRFFESKREEFRKLAANGYSSEDALELVHSQRWKWTEGYFGARG